VVESSGRKVPSRILDISERGAKITCVPGLALGSVGTISIQGMLQPMPFTVRGGTQDSASLEIKVEGTLREQYLNWFSSVTRGRAAA
jgi:hypothetical protein